MVVNSVVRSLTRGTRNVSHSIHSERRLRLEVFEKFQIHVYKYTVHPTDALPEINPVKSRALPHEKQHQNGLLAKFSKMRILLLTENPILAIGLEAALRQAGHTLLLSSTIAQLREQLVASSGDAEPPNVMVLDDWCDICPGRNGLAVMPTVSTSYLLKTTKWLKLYPIAAPMKMSDGKCAWVGSRDSERNAAVP